jgi:hypothetical protein
VAIHARAQAQDDWREDGALRQRKKESAPPPPSSKWIGLLRYIQTQKHPGRKASGDTPRGAVRAAARTAVTGFIVAACAHRPAWRAPRCQKCKNLTVGVFETT